MWFVFLSVTIFLVVENTRNTSLSLNNFKVHKSVVFRTFSMSHHYHHWVIPEHSHQPGGVNYPASISDTSPPPPQQPPVCFLCLRTFHTNGATHRVAFRLAPLTWQNVFKPRPRCSSCPCLIPFAWPSSIPLSGWTPPLRRVDLFIVWAFWSFGPFDYDK